MPENKGLYARCHAQVIDQLQYLSGKKWTADDMCRWLGIKASAAAHKPFRDGVVKVLYNLTKVNKNPIIKQEGNFYRVVEKELDVIDWWSEKEEPPSFDITFPYGVDDQTSFRLEEGVSLIPGDCAVVAGETNTGKTAFMINIAVNNCDKYPVTIFSSEFNKYKFKQRITGVDWVDYLNGHGNPKFELIRRNHSFEDAVAERPDNICLIDWIKMEEDLYKMGALIGKIKDQNRNGLTFISIQKRSYKALGEGGESTLERADLYLNLCFERLEVLRVKTPNIFNAQDKKYHFSLGGAGGVRFGNIYEIKTCPICYGTGKHRGSNCERCEGSGYVDK